MNVFWRHRKIISLESEVGYMSDENVKRYEKSKEVVDGLINALRVKAASHQLNGAAIVMGFEKSQLDIERAGLVDVIAIDEEEGTSLDMVQIVVDYCNSCLRAMRDSGAEHFGAEKYDKGISVGCAVLNIEDMLFMVVVASNASTLVVEKVLRLGDVCCPFRIWYRTYDCMVCYPD